MWEQVSGLTNSGQNENNKNSFQSAVQHIPIGEDHFEYTLFTAGIIRPRDMQTVTVTDISDCSFTIAESSDIPPHLPTAGVLVSAPPDQVAPSIPAAALPPPGFPDVPGPPPPQDIPSGLPNAGGAPPAAQVSPSGAPSLIPVSIIAYPNTTTAPTLNVPTPTAIDPGNEASVAPSLHVHSKRPPVQSPSAISHDGNSTIPVGNAAITPSDPSSPQNSTPTQDPPSSQTPISSQVSLSTYKSSSIPIAHVPPNIPENTVAVVNPAPPPNPTSATSSSAVVDGDPTSSQTVASTPNNGSLALRPRAVETPFGRSNWTWSNSFSRQMKAQITPRALPKIVERDQDPTTVIHGAVVCVIIPQMVAASPPSSPTSYFGNALRPIPNPPSPAPPAAPPPVAVPGLLPSPPSARTRTRTSHYLPRRRIDCNIASCPCFRFTGWIATWY